MSLSPRNLRAPHDNHHLSFSDYNKVEVELRQQLRVPRWIWSRPHNVEDGDQRIPIHSLVDACDLWK